jgi:8-oxo-dGTP pyrophosphatase MutT (NUDIX family)
MRMPIRIRPTARVILLDPQNRVLLMKGRLPARPQGPAAWFTIGGGVEPGESVHEAAAREIVEETGFTDAVLGAIVWTGEVRALTRRREPVLVQDHYILARTCGGAIDKSGWQALEREFVDDIAWWRHTEIAASQDTFYPLELATLLPDLIAGHAPASPIRLPDRVVD